VTQWTSISTIWARILRNCLTATCNPLQEKHIFGNITALFALFLEIKNTIHLSQFYFLLSDLSELFHLYRKNRRLNKKCLWMEGTRMLPLLLLFFSFWIVMMDSRSFRSYNMPLKVRTSFKTAVGFCLSLSVIFR
jgi:hypothetical protein